MEKFEYLPHTADIRVKIESDSLPGLFRAALQSMNEVIKKEVNRGKKVDCITKKVEVRSINTTVLLIDFLSEILTETHTLKAVFPDLKIEFLSDNYIVAKVKGYPVDDFDEDIKAVTYHEAEVIKNDKGYWETMLIFDI